jgi:hypothetical protein
MGANSAVPMSTKIAIVTKYLKAFGVVMFLEPVIQAKAGAMNLSQLVATTFDMVKREKAEFDFAAAFTLAVAVGIQGFDTQSRSVLFVVLAYALAVFLVALVASGAHLLRVFLIVRCFLSQYALAIFLVPRLQMVRLSHQFVTLATHRLKTVVRAAVLVEFVHALRFGTGRATLLCFVTHQKALQVFSFLVNDTPSLRQKGQF